MCFILTVCGRLVMQRTMAAVLADKKKRPFMGLVVAALYILFSRGIYLLTALVAILVGIMEAHLVPCRHTVGDLLSLKIFPWRGILANGHLLKASSSSAFTVV